MLVQAGLKRPARRQADSSRGAIAFSAAAGALLAGAGLVLLRRRR
jgi:LPXTG-motif cell wall-anchored protein